MKKWTILWIWHLLVCSGLIAQPFQPNVLPHLEAVRIAHPIKIDGVLQKEEWGGIKEVNNFSETYPGDLVKPPVKTRVKVAYDHHYLYFAFFCEDDPQKIRASLTDRDNIFQDDYVGIILDTYGNSQWAVFVASNPFGIQGDTRISSSSGEDSQFDLVYESAGKIVDKGYIVEMAIPFSSLRFPAKNLQIWRINFWRTHPRDSRRTYSWAAINRDDPCLLCQSGFLEGIKGIHSSRNLELLPSFVGTGSSELNNPDNPEAGFENIDIQGSAGVGFKWAVNPSLTIETTINPDFSQIESDAAQIDVNQNFALFYPEKRPFFQEGSDLFRTMRQVVYTRSINDPIAASKIIGRWQKTTLALLSGIDDKSLLILPFQEKTGYAETGRNINNIARIKHTLGPGAFIGGLVTDRRYQNSGYNTVAGIDGKFRFGKVYSLEFQFLKSFNQEPEDSIATEELMGENFNDGRLTSSFDGEYFNGNLLAFELERDGRSFKSNFEYQQVSPEFRADNGFIFQNDIRIASFWTGYQLYPNNKIIDRFMPNINFARKWNYKGTIKDHWANPSVNIILKKQTSVRIGYLINSERYKNQNLNDINRLILNVNSNFSERIKAGVSIFKGKFVANRADSVPVRGKGNNIGVWLEIKPSHNISIVQEFSFQDMVRMDNHQTEFSGFIYRVRSQYQFNRELYVRMIAQYNRFSEQFSLEPLISYQLNPFTVFYAGSSLHYLDFDSFGWSGESRQYFLKIQYLLAL